jgi:hypothetical protein
MMLLQVSVMQGLRYYKGNNGGEREAGHHREEKTTMVWPCQEDATGENTKINFGMGTYKFAIFPFNYLLYPHLFLRL